MKKLKLSMAVALWIIGIQLLWPLIAQLLVWIYRKLREFTHVSQISRKIADKSIQGNGDWGPVLDSVNAGLHKIEGRSAAMKIFVSLVQSTPDGQYSMIPRIIALEGNDQRTRLRILLYTYFDGADAAQIDRIRGCNVQDPLRIRGKISRADIHNYPDIGWCLNIDLHNCAVI